RCAGAGESRKKVPPPCHKSLPRRMRGDDTNPGNRKTVASPTPQRRKVISMKQLFARLFGTRTRAPRRASRNAATPGRKARLDVEALERRDLMTAGISLNAATGILAIEGSTSGDTAQVTIVDPGGYYGTGALVIASLSHDGVSQSASFNLVRYDAASGTYKANVTGIVFHGYDGNDF